MKENIKLFKNWYKLVKPNKAVWFFQLITCIIPIICSFCEAAFAAKATASIASGNLLHGVFCLGLVLILVILRCLSWDLNYRNFTKLMSEPYLRIQSQFYEKIIHAKNSNFKITSKEKIINIFHSDTYDAIDFADTICSQIRYLVYIIMTLIYIGSINIYICILIFLVIIMNSIIVEKLNSKLSRAQFKRKDKIDAELEHFSKVLETREVISDLNIESKMKQEYLNSSKDYLYMLNEYNTKLSYIDNYFVIFYKGLIFIFSIIMIYLLKDNVISLTIYFMVISYITDTITNSTELLALIKELKLISICVNRINLILNFEEKDILSFGDIKKDDIKGEIDFLKVSYSGSKELGLAKINNITFNILNGDVVLFKGSSKGGRKTIFYLLRRIIKPKKGTILIDKLNILSYDKLTHNSNINYVSSNPIFFSDTIKKNLKIINKNKKDIKETLKTVELLDKITKEYKYKLNTNIFEISERDRYFIGLARTLLTKSEIIMFYDLPKILTKNDIELIKKIIIKLKKKNTILIFDDENIFNDITNKTYQIKEGQII